MLASWIYMKNPASDSCTYSRPVDTLQALYLVRPLSLYCLVDEVLRRGKIMPDEKKNLTFRPKKKNDGFPLTRPTLFLQNPDFFFFFFFWDWSTWHETVVPFSNVAVLCCNSYCIFIRPSSWPGLCCLRDYVSYELPYEIGQIPLKLHGLQGGHK